jgi:hypothetical protein
MAQSFIVCDGEQELLLPPSLWEWLSGGHLVWFVIDAVAEMDLTAFFAALSSGRAWAGGARSGADGGVAVLRVRRWAAFVACDRAGVRRRCRVPRDRCEPAAG